MSPLICACGGPKYRYANKCRKCSEGSRLGKNDPATDPVRRPTATEIAWAAGLYEGEGSCLFHAGSFVICIPQQDPSVLERLPILWGGRIGGLRSNGCHSWNIHGLRAKQFVEDTWEWLSVRRREQIDVAYAKAFGSRTTHAKSPELEMS